MSDTTSTANNGLLSIGVSPREAVLEAIAQRESGNRNVFNYMYRTDPQRYSASGYWQILDSTWGEGAKMAGVDISQYPRAIDAPRNVQKQVAGALYDKYGERPWAASAPNALAASPKGVAQIPVTPQVNPLAAQAPSMQQPSGVGPDNSIALMLMSALLPKGWGFHKIDYDPFVAEKVAQQAPTPVGELPTFRFVAVKSPQAQAATSPEAVPSRVGQKLSLAGLQREVTGPTSG